MDCTDLFATLFTFGDFRQYFFPIPLEVDIAVFLLSLQRLQPLAFISASAESKCQFKRKGLLLAREASAPALCALRHGGRRRIWRRLRRDIFVSYYSFTFIFGRRSANGRTLWLCLRFFITKPQASCPGVTPLCHFPTSLYLAVTTECLKRSSECHNLSSECHNLSSECHRGTRECHAVSSECHKDTRECHKESSECLGDSRECHRESSECRKESSECLLVTLECMELTPVCCEATPKRLISKMQRLAFFYDGCVSGSTVVFILFFLKNAYISS